MRQPNDFTEEIRIYGAFLHVSRLNPHILLQGTPQDLDLHAAIAAIRELEGVTDVHHVHAWSLTSGVNVF